MADEVEADIEARPLLSLPPLPAKQPRAWPSDRILRAKTMQDYDDLARELRVSCREVREKQCELFKRRYGIDIS